MRPRDRAPTIYMACAVAVVLAIHVMVGPFIFIGGPSSLSGWTPIAPHLAAITVLAVVFGVGAMLRPVASLAGAVVASALTPVTCFYPSPFEVIWLSWCLGTLARWILLSVRFVHNLIARPDKPSPDGTAKLDAEAPNERARVDESTPNVETTA